MSNAVAAASLATAAGEPIRVMVVDDAVVARRLLTRWIDAEPDMTVAAALRTGREAIDEVERYDPQVVVLDISMPEIDGITALPLLLKKKRDLVVIMASTLTRRGAEVSLRALSLGAADYVAKPQSGPEAATSGAFHRELIEKIRSLGRGRGLRRTPESPAPVSDPREARPRLYGASLERSGAVPAFTLRPFARSTPRALLIGSSTGGPQALTVLVQQLGEVIDRVPVLITQHMPPTFTTVLAEHLTRVGGRQAHEAAHGEPIVAGQIYVAPGGHHMRVVRGADAPGPDPSAGPSAKIALDDDAPINFCRPAVDPLFSSAARIWGTGSLALLLTGMGSDGTNGAAVIASAGGSVIAQDEESSAVWGMPRSAAYAGLCSAVLPLGEIATTVKNLVSGGRS